MWDSIELGCGISRLRLGSAPEARASAPVGPMSSGSYDNYSDPNPNTLSSALQGSYPDFPMVAPGLSGPRWKPPSTADRQATLPSAKKELAKAQPWRVDEWREFKFFERALRRYLRITDASLLSFLNFWLLKQSPESLPFREDFEHSTIQARCPRG